MTMLQEYLKKLEPLVNLDCGTHNQAGVTRAAEIMKGYFESIGFTCEIIDLGPTVGKGLLARNKPEADHYDVMLNGHLDTVFNELNADSYVVESPDAIEPATKDAHTVMRYSENNLSAGVAYQGDYKTLVLGFPFESIRTDSEREAFMNAVLTFFNDNK